MSILAPRRTTGFSTELICKYSFKSLSGVLFVGKRSYPDYYSPASRLTAGRMELKSIAMSLLQTVCTYGALKCNERNR